MRNLELKKSEDRGWRRRHPAPVEPVLNFRGKFGQDGDVDLSSLKSKSKPTAGKVVVAPIVSELSDANFSNAVYALSPTHPQFPNILFGGARRSELYEQNGSSQNGHGTRWGRWSILMVREFQF